MRKRKLLITLLIIHSLFVSGCSQTRLPEGVEIIENRGNSYIYNGKTYTVYSILRANKAGKQVGVTDNGTAIYELESLDSNSWLASQGRDSRGTDIFSILKEKNATEFSLDSFPVDEIEIVAIPGTSISGIIIKDEKIITELINRFKNGDRVMIQIPDGRLPTAFLELHSNKYPDLMYGLSYYTLNGKNYIRNGKGEMVEIGDLLRVLNSIQSR